MYGGVAAVSIACCYHVDKQFAELLPLPPQLLRPLLMLPVLTGVGVLHELGDVVLRRVVVQSVHQPLAKHPNNRKINMVT